MKHILLAAIIAVFITGCSAKTNCQQGDVSQCVELYMDGRSETWVNARDDKPFISVNDDAALAAYWYERHTGKNLEKQIEPIVKKENPNVLFMKELGQKLSP